MFAKLGSSLLFMKPQLEKVGFFVLVRCVSKIGLSLFLIEFQYEKIGVFVLK